ncbi:MAG: hypothetical protein E2604_09015 [Flavobacterium sp.]|nr:hypothetical protein [Flavobacterium sp.]
MRIKKNIKALLILAVVMLLSLNANAQCAMCRAALESEEGGVKAEAVNDGIVYLMVIPYVLVGVLGYAIYRLKTKKKKIAN